jgi:hypothetical protein
VGKLSLSLRRYFLLRYSSIVSFDSVSFFRFVIVFVQVLFQFYSIMKYNSIFFCFLSVISIGSAFPWITPIRTSSRVLCSSSSYSSSTLGATAGGKKKVFIDGEAGTTGLQVRQRLEGRQDLELLSPPPELRKDAETRKALMNEADAVILCLPDAAAIEAVGLVTNPNTVLIDASTAFRTHEAWTYGFPGMSSQG